MSERTSWTSVSKPTSERAREAYDDEARISAFRDLVVRLRTDAGLTQAELATRMGTTQSAIARMEGGGARPTLEALERLAVAVGKELVVASVLGSTRTHRSLRWSAPVTQSFAGPADLDDVGDVERLG